MAEELEHSRVVYLDTTVLVLLGQGQTQKLGVTARRALEKYDLLVSAAVLLEVELLHEIGRLRPNAARVMETLARDFGLRVCEMSFHTIVECAIDEGWTRDPFDRLIVANARAARAPLVAKDERIRRNYKLAVW